MVAVACALSAAASQGQTLQIPKSPPLSLADAISRAELANPAIRAREAQQAAGEGLRREAASILFNNPQFSFEQARRRAPGAPPAGDVTTSERAFGFAQPFETGGQQGRRRQAAAANLDAIRAEIDDARRQVRAETAARFHAVLVAQRRVEIEERSQSLFESSAAAVARRRAAGEDARLDANVALIEAERSRNALAAAREQLLDARMQLATVLQLPPSQVPQVQGELDPAHVGWPSYRLDQMLQSVQSQPRLIALTARESAARARLSVETGHRSPDVTLGLNVGREGLPGARERVTTLSISLPLPLFRRNDAAIGQAQADLTQAELERTVALRDSEADVRRLWVRLESQGERVQRLQQAMLPAAQDNQQLAGKSRQAGQIGLLDQLVINRQTLDAERELNDALGEFHATRIELERAAGWSQEGTAR
jgi:cobalt-zinc-cadmium efflux system outer membrane protein